MILIAEGRNGDVDRRRGPVLACLRLGELDRLLVAQFGGQLERPAAAAFSGAVGRLFQDRLNRTATSLKRLPKLGPELASIGPELASKRISQVRATRHAVERAAGPPSGPFFHFNGAKSHKT
jgi:hypothetical protein